MTRKVISNDRYLELAINRIMKSVIAERDNSRIQLSNKALVVLRNYIKQLISGLTNEAIDLMEKQRLTNRLQDYDILEILSNIEQKQGYNKLVSTQIKLGNSTLVGSLAFTLPYKAQRGGYND